MSDDTGSTVTQAPLDRHLAQAVDIARDALHEDADPVIVGDHLDVVALGERAVAHVFECTAPGYVGWQWHVVLARAARAKQPTVCETSLLPGQDALIAPPWVPWADRLQPGDLSAGDELPRIDDDARLQPGFEPVGDEDADHLAQWELGLGRHRVLSAQGRMEAASRWNDGDFGPSSAVAQSAKAQCSSCGFLIPLPGALRSNFGICAQEWSPADGRVVSLLFGCGAHSETDVQAPDRSLPEPVVDELAIDPLEINTSAVAPASEPAESSEQAESTEPDEQTQGTEPNDQAESSEPTEPDEQAHSAEPDDQEGPASDSSS